MLNVLEEMRDLLTLIAEPQIAARDKKQRVSLRDAVGKSAKARQAVLLMDGTRKQKEISDSVPIAKGQLSELAKELAARGLCVEGPTGPKLTIPISEKVFDEENAQ